MMTLAARETPSFVARALLETPTSLDFAHTLSFLCSFAPTRGEQRVAQGVLTKACSLDGRAVLTRIEATRGGLALEVVSESPLEAQSLARLVERLRFQLSLDDDLTGFRALAEADPAFAPVAQRWAGHHHVKFPTPFEIAVWAVLAQRNQRLGRGIKDRLVAALGPRLVVEGEEHRAFPEASRVADLAPSRLRSLVGDTPRADAIAILARVFAQPSFERWLREAPLDVAESELRALPQIGPWSAAFVLFRGLGRMERLAGASAPILAAAARVYGPRSERELRTIAARYGGWCGYWALYLRRG
ncbi:MAG: hypothetical protein K1X94_12645 [Sandaracinaceae bacterium]|nr:hypothetical protein [Sandaracinaceae bacterium]